MSTTEQHPLYPDVEVQLTGLDGNAFVLMGAVSKALRRAGAVPEEIIRFRDEATSGDYDHLLQTCMRWVRTS